MALQSILDNIQTIGAQGNYQVAPKLPAPKIQPVNYVNVQPPNNPLSAPTGGGGSPVDELMKALKQQESSNNYGATNPSGASGGYQILRSNFEGPGGWDKEALGHDVTYQQFMSSPIIQDQIARYKLQAYIAKYGLAGAAAAWYGGPGAVKNQNSTSIQPGGYPSISAYIKAVLDRMR